MNVFEAITTLLAVREYRPDPLPAELVSRIVEAGRLTGSAMNKQPWHFVVVQERATITKLGELAKTGPYIAQAPLAIAVAIEDTPFAVSDGSLAIHSMMLTAWAEGVGSNWVGFANLDDVHQLLALPPTLKVLAVLPFGYPAKPGGAGLKKRKPVQEVVSYERYGQ